MLAAAALSFMMILITGSINVAGAAFFAPAISVYVICFAVFTAGLKPTIVRTAAVRLEHGHGRDALLYLRYSFRISAAISLAAAVILAVVSYPVCSILSLQSNAYLAFLMITPSVPALCMISILSAYFECAGLKLIGITANIVLGILGFILALIAGPRVRVYGDRIADLLRSESYGSLYGAAGAAAGLSAASLIVMLILLVVYFMLRGTITENILKESIQTSADNRRELIRLSQTAPLYDVLYYVLLLIPIPAALLLLNVFTKAAGADTDTAVRTAGILFGRIFPVLFIAGSICVSLFSGMLTGIRNAADREDRRTIPQRSALLMRIMVYLLIPAAAYVFSAAQPLTALPGQAVETAGAVIDSALLLRILSAGLIFHVLSFAVSSTGLRSTRPGMFLLPPGCALIIQVLVSFAGRGKGDGLSAWICAAMAVSGFCSFIIACIVWRIAYGRSFPARTAPAVKIILTGKVVVCALAGGAVSLIISHFMYDSAGAVITIAVSLILFLLVFNIAAVITGAADIKIMKRIPGGMAVIALAARFSN